MGAKLYDYDFEIENIISEIKKNKAKIVVLQLPDGLKPCADEIIKELSLKSNATFFLWGGSNFGSCDVPNIKADLLVHFGHTKWN